MRADCEYGADCLEWTRGEWNPFDTAVAAAHLIFGGVLDRLPRLEVCLPHGGGALPYLAGRLEHGYRWTERHPQEIKRARRAADTHKIPPS